MTGSLYFVSPDDFQYELETLGLTGIDWEYDVEDFRVVFSLSPPDPLAVSVFLGHLREKFGPLWIRAGTTKASHRLFNLLEKQQKQVVFAESCTGGLLSKIITDIPGSSGVFWGGFIVYSNEAKSSMIGVKKATINRYGAVSPETARAMAEGALFRSQADLAVSVTGIAGPEGGTEEKPLGTVWISVKKNKELPSVRRFHFQGSRAVIREKTAIGAFLFTETCFIGEDVLDSWTP